MKYTVTAQHAHRHLVDFEFTVINWTESILRVQQPSWRPGRYELGNFAKNIKSWTASDDKGNPLKFKKLNKDLWEIETSGISTIRVQYSYFANEITAGSSCFNADMLYLNPVNCFMYVPGLEHEPCEVELAGLPENYEIACQMERSGLRTLHAPNYDYLADSPLIASDKLKHFRFSLGASEIHLWFQGNFFGDFGEILTHTYDYCNKQVEIFGELPCKKYHFLYHILPYPFHHGVEHLDSTVIALGPAGKFSDIDFYREFLGVSSHEFYHLWNIKRIRPAEMFPYNFTKENYSRQGYVYEGVTTYMGDLMLMRSGVFEWDEYAATFSNLLQRHFDNYGRYNLSVAASSWDTWLDGYVPGVFGRKVSIYVEGALAAFILDTMLMELSGNKISVDDVMRRLYTDYYKQNKGYTQQDYLQLINELSGRDMGQYMNEVLEGCGFIEQYLPAAMDRVGCRLMKKDSPLVYERNWGVKLAYEQENWTVKAVAPGSPADEAGIGEGEIILEVNGLDISGLKDLKEHLPVASLYMLRVRGNNRERELDLPKGTATYWHRYSVEKNESARPQQKETFSQWTQQAF